MPLLASAGGITCQGNGKFTPAVGRNRYWLVSWQESPDSQVRTTVWATGSIYHGESLEQVTTHIVRDFSSLSLNIEQNKGVLFQAVKLVAFEPGAVA